MAKKKKKPGVLILLRDGFISTCLSLVVCYLISILFFNISFFNPLSKALEDFSFLDVYYSERLNDNPKIEPNIVLLNIEHANRLEITNALQAILKEEPKVVGFDIILKAFEQTAVDSTLASLLNHKKVVTGYVLSDYGTVSNHSFFKGKGPTGFVNFNFGYQDAVVREFTGFFENAKKTHKAFSVEVAKKFLSKKAWKKQDLDEKLTSSRVINYVGGYERFPNFTISEFMSLSDKSLVKDKVVLLGYLGTPTGNKYDVEDKHFTPLNEVTAGKSIPDMNGLTLHANIVSMIITNNFMYKVSNFWLLIITFVSSFMASIYFIWLDKRLKISYRTVRKAILFVFAVLMIWVTLLLFKYGIVLKSAPIIAVTVFSAGFIKYYKHVVRYINTKRKFKSHLK